MVTVLRPHRLIVLLAALVAFGPLSIDMYLPSLPLIAEDLGAVQSDIQLTISSFLIGLFIGMLFYGPLSDKLGRRPLLLAGISLYLVASVACAFCKPWGLQRLLCWQGPLFVICFRSVKPLESYL